MGYENNPTTGSSEEFWAMYWRMTQQISGEEEGLTVKSVRGFK